MEETSRIVAFGETLRSGGYHEEKRQAESAVATGVSGGRGGGDEDDEADDDDEDDAEVIVEVGTGIVVELDGQGGAQVVQEVLEDLSPSQQVELLRLSAFAAAAAAAGA